MRMVLCWACRGSGMQNGLLGPVCCSLCRGDCVVPMRDRRGRFTSDVPTAEEVEL